jgi:hypothetical protein
MRSAPRHQHRSQSAAMESRLSRAWSRSVPRYRDQRYFAGLATPPWADSAPRSAPNSRMHKKVGSSLIGAEMARLVGDALTSTTGPEVA